MDEHADAASGALLATGSGIQVADGPGTVIGEPGNGNVIAGGSTWGYSNWRLTTTEPNGSGALSAAGIKLWPDTNGGLSGWDDVARADALPDHVCKF